jgi:hypothetical protein
VLLCHNTAGDDCSLMVAEGGGGIYIKVRDEGAVDGHDLAVGVEVSPQHGGKDRDAPINLLITEVGHTQDVDPLVGFLELTRRILDAERDSIPSEERCRLRLRRGALEQKRSGGDAHEARDAGGRVGGGLQRTASSISQPFHCRPDP